jgi:hypothetical protein
MDKKYIELFIELAKATAVAAEQVMDYDKAKNDEDGFKTAQTMRDDYNVLFGKLKDNSELDKADFAKLLVGALITVNQIQDRITALQKGLAGYQTDLIPKLNKVIDAESDEDARKIANEEFNIKEN